MWQQNCFVHAVCACLLAFVCDCTSTHVSGVPVCANKDNSAFCLGMRPHFVFEMPECQIIPCERAGGTLLLLQALEGKRKSFGVVSMCFGSKKRMWREKDRVGAFKSPPALWPKSILFELRLCFIICLI